METKLDGKLRMIIEKVRFERPANWNSLDLRTKLELSGNASLDHTLGIDNLDNLDIFTLKQWELLDDLTPTQLLEAA
jgi:hypothetical protein